MKLGRRLGLTLGIAAFAASLVLGWWVFHEVKEGYRSMSTDIGIRPPW
ncbi:MAG: hypothetical protein H7338_05130 [Candidatus Sericytochromatia bacterium]|nr:hypothetical protein [Candidatus Sericytochromatia bacterium]